MKPFHDRAVFCLKRFQQPWQETLEEPGDAIVSMSAMHHLDPAGKATFYARCGSALVDQGVLLNGYEVRRETDEADLDDL